MVYMDFYVRHENSSSRNTAGLFDICEWFVEKYPDYIFVDKNNPVTQIRDLCKNVLNMRKDK